MTAVMVWRYHSERKNSIFALVKLPWLEKKIYEALGTEALCSISCFSQVILVVAIKDIVCALKPCLSFSGSHTKKLWC